MENNMIPEISNKLVDELDEKMYWNHKGRGDGVMLYSDNLFAELYHDYKEGVSKDGRDLLFYLYLNAFSGGGRYQSIETRLTWAQHMKEGLGEDNNFSMYLSGILGQGLPQPVTWRGKPMYKSANDQSILHMLLHNLRPRTIIEIGTGNGSSAEYMADMMSIFGYGCKIITFDCDNENRTSGNIQYVYADCDNLDTFNVVDYGVLEHPWLVVEDVHVNVGPVISYFADKMVVGDMMIVEDSVHKQEDIRALPHTFNVDTKYTDYFGFNNTSSFNSIFKVL
jgi:hypothetical protein